MKIQSKMSEDEEDYMSDAFLAKCIPEDVRPGLKRVSYKISYELFLAIYFLEYCKNVSRKRGTIHCKILFVLLREIFSFSTYSLN